MSTQEARPPADQKPNTIRSFLEGRQSAVPECLYHYTSAAGLMSIVESGRIRATKIQHLNDMAEFNHALVLAHEYLLELAAEASPPLQDALEKMLGQLEALREVEVYVACFSEDGDLLSQWRAYCPRGGGFSLGLGPTSILLSARYDPDVSLRRCVYLPNEQRQLVRDAVDWCLGDPVSVRASAAWPHNVGVWFYRIMALTAPIIKHTGFSEEREWRLIVPGTHGSFGVRFRAAESMLVPYVECPLRKDDSDLDLRRVVVGPTAELGLSFDATRRYIGGLGLSNTRIATTAIPYRNW